MTQIQPREDKYNAIRTRIESEAFTGDIKKALSKRIPEDYFIRCALTTFRRAPELLSCEPSSIFQALMESAQLGLPIDGQLGHAYMVKFGAEATLIPGYKGLIQLALRGGEVEKIVGRCVYESDIFSFEYGTHERIEHKPAFEDRGDPEFFYAIGWMKNGNQAFVVLTRDEVDKIRSRSPGKNSPAWRDNYVQMGIKTAVRSLFKWLPLREEAQRAAGIDEQYDAGVEPREVKIEVSGDGKAPQAADVLDRLSEIEPVEARNGPESRSEPKGSTEPARPRKRRARANKAQRDAFAQLLRDAKMDAALVSHHLPDEDEDVGGKKPDDPSVEAAFAVMWSDDATALLTKAMNGEFEYKAAPEPQERPTAPPSAPQTPEDLGYQ